MKDYFGYKGKICVVTGAASGMGKAAAEMLVDLGAKVYALDYAEVKVPGIEKFVQVNLAEKDSIDQAFSQIPDTIDSFFGVAGVSGQKHDFNTTVCIDFISNKYITEEYLTKRMPEGGAISYVTSEAGLRWEKPEVKAEYISLIAPKGWDDTYAALKALDIELPGPVGYGFAKRAMNYYVAHIAAEYGLKKIRVNALLPGATDTGLTDDFAISVGGRGTLEKFTGSAQRLATPREMAEPLVFLNSDMASYIAGVLLDVDYALEIGMVAGIIPDWYGKPLLS